MNLLISFRSEIIKTKRTAAFYFTLVGAAVVPIVFLLNVAIEGLEDTRKDPLNAIFKLQSEMNGLAFFPFFVVLICTLLPQIEYRNNTWKQVLTSPKTKDSIYLAKWLNIHLLLLLFLVSSLLFMSVAVVMAHFIDPTLNLLNQPFDKYKILVNTVNSYITLMAVCAMQFWLGLRFRNFLVPVGVGLALWLIGTVLALEYHSPMVNYFPYSFHIFGVIPSYKPGLNAVAWWSAGYTALFLFLGFFDFKRRRMNA